jgi:hypothetical protein
MTPATPADTADRIPAEADAEPRCVICIHRLCDHDRISLRFCEATQTQALTRTCVCPPT